MLVLKNLTTVLYNLCLLPFNVGIFVRGSDHLNDMTKIYAKGSVLGSARFKRTKTRALCGIVAKALKEELKKDLKDKKYR